jgi:hypothetical protein
MKSTTTFRPFQLFMLATIISGCAAMRNADLNPSYDPAKQAKRYRIEQSYLGKVSNYALITVNQTILKEIFPNGSAVYTVYDLMYLKSFPFQVNDTVFYIVDNKAFACPVKNANPDKIRWERSKPSDLNPNIIDTKVTENENYKMEYHLSDKLVESVREAKNISFQYYTGPDIITVKLSQADLNRFKRLVNQDLIISE